jgi:hypothetical protein
VLDISPELALVHLAEDGLGGGVQCTLKKQASNYK